MTEESIADGVGAGLDRRDRFRPVAAWAWVWRNFDLGLPDVTGAAWQTDPAAAGSGDAGGPGAAGAEPAGGRKRLLAFGPW